MWRFRKSFYPLPGVRLTLSSGGISTSVGVGPFRISAGPSGPRLTATVPGAGLSWSRSLQDSGNSNALSVDPTGKPPIARAQSSAYGGEERIESSDATILTTPGIAEFRKLLDRARRLHLETSRELKASQTAECAAKKKYLGWKNGWLLRRLMKIRFAKLETEASETEARRAELQEQEILARLETQIEIPGSIEAVFSRFSDAFSRISESARIWDTVSHRAADQFRERTRASRIVERRPVRFQIGRCDVIQSDWRVPHLENANGGDLFLFPLFVVYFADSENFALLEYRDVRMDCRITGFHEKEAVPGDSKVIGKTWAKTNKDGSRDRRFKENYEIPVVQYGKIIFQSTTGLNEEYMVSSVSACQAFATEWNALVQGITLGA